MNVWCVYVLLVGGGGGGGGKEGERSFLQFTELQTKNIQQSSEPCSLHLFHAPALVGFLQALYLMLPPLLLLLSGHLAAGQLS